MTLPFELNQDASQPIAREEDVLRLRAEHEAFLKASQATVRDTTRLTRLFTVLSEPAPLGLMLDRVLSTLSEIFAADIVVLLDPAGSGNFAALAAIGLPEEIIHVPMSGDDEGYVAMAMASGSPIVRTGVSCDPTADAPLRELGAETAVWIPVIGSHAARGALILARCHATPFAQDDVALLTAMAYRIGLALDQAQHRVQLERLVQSGRKISRNLDESTVYSEATRMLPTVVGASAAALVLVDAEGVSEFVAQWGLNSVSSSEWMRLTEHLLPSLRVSGFQPYMSSDFQAAVHEIPEAVRKGLPARALLAVPVRREERIQGVLYAVRASAVAFAPDTVQIAVLFAAQTSAALENARLYQTVQDELAERVLAERRLSESEERLQLALEGADLGMWDWNVLTGEVRFNERWPAMLGYAPEEIEPHVRSWDRLIHPDDAAHVREALQSHLEGRSAQFETEHRFLASAGGWVWVLNKGKVTHRDSEGRPLRFVGTCFDITEAKRAQADRLLFEEQKHQTWRAESLGRMAGGVAHHFNNQLQVVMGNLERAQAAMIRGGSAGVLIDNAMKASSRAAEISQLMLAYLGQMKGKAEPIDLVDTVEGVLSFLIISIPKNVRLKTDLPPRGPVILADGVQIKQVLSNLVSNAVEAIGDSEGEIRISVGVAVASDTEDTKVFLADCHSSSQSYAWISVSDTGCGMDAQTQQRIFEPFFTTKTTGRGLGLSVTLGIVRSYGGSIGVDSEPGGGTSLRLVFPALGQDSGVSHRSETPEPPRFQGSGLVLVVDDEPMIRMLAQAQLESMGYEVAVACDGMEAIERFKSSKAPIDFVLLDLSMPRMDGWETLNALRALRPDVCVIIASGYSETQAMQGVHGERPQAFLHKPYKMADLQSAIETTILKVSQRGDAQAIDRHPEGRECPLRQLPAEPRWP